MIQESSEYQVDKMCGNDEEGEKQNGAEGQLPPTFKNEVAR